MVAVLVKLGWYLGVVEPGRGRLPRKSPNTHCGKSIMAFIKRNVVPDGSYPLPASTAPTTPFFRSCCLMHVIDHHKGLFMEPIEHASLAFGLLLKVPGMVPITRTVTTGSTCRCSSCGRVLGVSTIKKDSNGFGSFHSFAFKAASSATDDLMGLLALLKLLEYRARTCVA